MQDRISIIESIIRSYPELSEKLRLLKSSSKMACRGSNLYSDPTVEGALAELPPEEQRRYNAINSAIRHTVKTYQDGAKRILVIRETYWNFPADEVHADEIKAKHKVMYAKHRKKILAKQAIYAAAHKEEIKRRQAEYHASHREELKEKNAQYVATHREEIKAYKAAYYQAHKEEIKARRRKKKEEAKAAKASAELQTNPTYAKVT